MGKRITGGETETSTDETGLKKGDEGRDGWVKVESKYGILRQFYGPKKTSGRP